MSDLKQDCTCLSTERDPLRHEPDCQHRANELAALRARHEKLRRLVPFLLGEAEHPDHPGIWFGGEHPTQGGKFWWRRSLRNALLEDE